MSGDAGGGRGGGKGFKPIASCLYERVSNMHCSLSYLKSIGENRVILPQYIS